MSGYARIHRDLLGHPAFRNDAEAMAFAWLVVRASWKPARVRYKGHAINLLRGQLALSVRDFAEAMDRDKGWVERLLRRLKSETMIETVSETGVLVITICNYEKFQASSDDRETVRETADETPARQPQDTEQEDKNLISEPNGSSGVVKTRAIKGHRISEDWAPAKPLPAEVCDLVAQWPPGRLERELSGFRDYWISRQRDAARTDWDRTWWNRIRDQHDRIMRESQHGRQRHPASDGPRITNARVAAAIELETERRGRERSAAF